MKILLATLLLSFMVASETIINVESRKEIKIPSTRITHLSLLPNSKTEVIVATDNYAYKVDLVSGKTIKKYKHTNSQTQYTGVYHTTIDPTGSFLCTVDVRGERQVWDIESGKSVNPNEHNKWIPTYRGLRDLDFNIKNDENHYIYLLKTADWNELQIQSRLNRLEVMDGAKVLQRIDIESNNGSHYPPILVRKSQLLVGSAKGELYIYDLNK